MNVTVEEIKENPEAIIHRVVEGETVVVTESGADPMGNIPRDIAER